MTKLKLSKFEVAERQLLLAIRLFLKEEDPVAIHTLSEAASQILFDLKDEHGISSLFRESPLIKDEYQKEWRKKLFKSKNFFKHADNDPDNIHEFNPVINELSLIDSVNMYETIKKKWVPETLVFTCWFMSEHPDWLIEGTDYHNVYKQSFGNTSETSDKAIMHDILNRIKNNEINLPYNI